MSIWPEADARLTELWHAGLPTKQIGLQLGVTKNAVVGHARRINLPGRPSPIRLVSANGKRVERIRRARGKTLPDLTPEGPAPALVPPAASAPRSSRHTCQWPVGDPRSTQFRFCGEPTELGKPYCGEHCRIAFPNYRGRHAP
jgi:GcrA cell cycle regulator